VLLEVSEGSFIYLLICLFIVNLIKMAVNQVFYIATGKAVKY
jgi:hypothetical protein